MHTLLGPDHYVPFVALARSRSWPLSRTLAVTAACGAGHVAGSLALGALGVAFGWALSGLVAVEHRDVVLAEAAGREPLAPGHLVGGHDGDVRPVERGV
ncbi:MAG: hypothetical protein F9K16_11835, partial [Thermoanaerobaculia bacterium]